MDNNLETLDLANYTEYVLMFYDKAVMKFNIKNFIIEILDKELLPIDLYLEEDNYDFDVRFNNRCNIEYWFGSRVLTLDRRFAKAILNSLGLSQIQNDRDKFLIAMKYRCLSLLDNYWVRSADEDIKYKDICLWGNSLNSALVDIALKGEHLTITNSDIVNHDVLLSGTMSKAWVREEAGFYLYKSSDQDEIDKEVYASKILEMLKLPHVEYIGTEYSGVPCSKCKCFTDMNNNILNASFYRYIDFDIESVIQKYREQYLYLGLVTYLIGNSDLHADNWGFLFDSNRKITGLIPNYDFNHAFECKGDFWFEPEELLFKRKITQLEFAKNAINELGIDIQLLPEENEYYVFVNNKIKSLFEK